MGRFQSRFTREYLDFREQLDNDQLLNLRAQLFNLLDDGALPHGVLTLVEVGGRARFHVYVDRVHEVVWMLGGHWLRQGEPARGFMEKMGEYAAGLCRGREPGC